MALTYASAIDAIVTHATAAGAAGTPPILDVSIGGPLPTSTRCVRVFYGGETDPVKMGGSTTLNSRMIAERIVLILWIAVTNLSQQEIAAVETEIYTFKHELRTRILGDSQLGGMATDLEMATVETDYLTYGGIRYRTVETEFTTDYLEYTITA